jgi:rusticyanin
VTRLEIILGAALTLVVGGGAGYAIAQAASPGAPAAALQAAPGHARPAARASSPAPGPGAPQAQGMPSMSAAGYSNDQLAQQIAQRAGTALAGQSPSYFTAASARALGSQVPRGARADSATDTITFSSPQVSFTVVAVPPGGPDMTFRIGGLVNPTLVLPAGATVRVEFINADTDEAHGWEITSAGPPFEFGLSGPALAGALARPLGDPTSAGDGAETITFAAGPAASYEYACPMPGHAQMGMHGRFVVR